jgi:hypothetical protein
MTDDQSRALYHLRAVLQRIDDTETTMYDNGYAEDVQNAAQQVVTAFHFYRSPTEVAAAAAQARVHANRERRRRNAAFGLHPDAPRVPDGRKPRPGVEYGCGAPTCTDCYEQE